MVGRTVRKAPIRDGNSIWVGLRLRGLDCGAYLERRFSLADHMKVMGAGLDNGLLHVDVVREVPEAAKLRTIKIGTTFETVRPEVTEQKAA